MKNKKLMKKNIPNKKNKKIKNSSFAKQLFFIPMFIFIIGLAAFIAVNASEEHNVKQKSNFIHKNNVYSENLEKFNVKTFEKELNEKLNNLNNNFEEYTNEATSDHILEHKNIPKIKNKNTNLKPEKKEYSNLENTDNFIYKKINNNKKGKLIIIIDDISNNTQKKHIQSIDYKINMSFLPPTKYHPKSAKITKDLPFYLIHFPLEANPTFKGPEPYTLNANDSYTRIEQRVKQLRKWYKNANFLNNHTGSVFTQNKEAMKKLFKALKKYHFYFIDSRTTSKSVAKEMAQKTNMPYITRNIFLDNKRDPNYIRKQLIKAINIAKKNTYAIAIGHPHDITIETLKKSKYLFKDVQPVYLNEILK